MGIKDRVWEIGLMIEPHLHIAGTGCETELKQVASACRGQWGDIEFFQKFFRDIARVYRTLFSFRQQIDPANCRRRHVPYLTLEARSLLRASSRLAMVARLS